MQNTNRRFFLKQTGTAVAGLSLLPWLTYCAADKVVDAPPLNGFARVSPESLGVDPNAIINFLETANASGLEWHSFMLLRHGKVFAEGWWDPFEPSFKHTLYSLSKSFTSTAVGFAIHEDKFQLTDKVISFFPDQLPDEVSEHLGAMNVKHLLTMNTGHESDSFGEILQNFDQSWISSFLAHPVPNAPGSGFLYDTGATFMLSAIVQKVTGESIDTYLSPRLFEPLGIENFSWDKSPEGICQGGVGLSVTMETIAKLGQLYLNEGSWNGKQIIPKEWVAEATSKQTETTPGEGEWNQGYGYQFWRCKADTVYRGDGAYGQYCIVIPKYDAVIAVNSESRDMGKSMEIIFDTLLPAFSQQPIDTNEEATTTITNIVSQLQLSLPEGATQSEIAATVSGKSYTVSENEFGVSSLQFNFEDKNCTLNITSDKGVFTLQAGLGAWTLNEERLTTPFPVFFRTDFPSKIGATAAWTSPDTLQINIKLVEGIHGDRYTCKFTDDSLEISFLHSLADESDRNSEKRNPIIGQTS